jgi:hydroxypyruvate isomerase
MPRFAANLSMMYTELPFLERFAACARDGFKAVEFLFPYAYRRPRSPRSCATTACSRCCSTRRRATSNAANGIASLPGREDEFRRGIDTAIEYACARMPARPRHGGPVAQRGERDTQWAQYEARIGWAAARLAEAGLDT